MAMLGASVLSALSLFSSPVMAADPCPCFTVEEVRDVCFKEAGGEMQSRLPTEGSEAYLVADCSDMYSTALDVSPGRTVSRCWSNINQKEQGPVPGSRLFARCFSVLNDARSSAQ